MRAFVSLRPLVNGHRGRLGLHARDVKRSYVEGRTRNWTRWNTRRTRNTEFETDPAEGMQDLRKHGVFGFYRGSFINWNDQSGDQRTGSIMNRCYDVINQVGEGAFGSVHAARCLATGEVVAIKQIPKDTASVAIASQMEVEFLKMADHPNVIRYYETMEDSEHIYLIMEMCSGGPLSKYIKNAHDNGFGFEEADMARIMIQMLRGVAYCHAHGIVHRDVKPQNFLFSYGEPGPDSLVPMACYGHGDAPLKMVDFGVSGVFGSDGKRWLTKSVGTDGFMAPEVLASRPYGPKADIFALGAVWHNMITGRPPTWDLPKSAYNFPGSIRWRKLSLEGQDMLRRFLSNDPEERPSASQAIKDPWFDSMGINQHIQDPMARWYFMQEVSDRVLDFPRRSKLQRAIMYCMVAFASLHSPQIERLRYIFDSVDPGIAGGIARAEFSTLLRSWGIDCPYNIEKLFGTINASNSGSISYSEFLTAALPEEWFNKDFRRAFDILDVDKNGYIEASDLSHLLPQIFNTGELEHEIRCLFPSSDGRMTFQDFCHISHVQVINRDAQWLYPWY